MSDLSDFFDRLDETAQRQNPMPAEDLVDAAALDRAAAAMTPLFDRMAERAGVELSEARDEIVQRVEAPVDVVKARIDAGGDVDEELTMLAGAAGLQFFLAGVIWEQGRHMPSVDA